MKVADGELYTTLAVKEVAASLGLTASCLAKTAPGEEGSSGHIHFSCWRDGRNAFADEKVMGAAVAGVLDHLPGASALLNPNLNSYKRLVPGFFAPTNVSWGLENRSAALRAIRSGREELTRIECRRPGADANPYLAIAAIVVSAADGLRRRAAPPGPGKRDAHARGRLDPPPRA